VTATILAAALSTLMAIQQQTDTLIAVPGDVRISLTGVSGDVAVSTWDQNRVRVLAEHGSDDRVNIALDGSELSISAASSMGLAIVDFELTVPTAASLNVSAPFADVRIIGTRGNVSVETVEGDIHLEGGRGQVQLHAVSGDVMVFETEASLEAASVDGDVTITNASGTIQAETVDGDVSLINAASESVKAASVDGDITWDGDIRDGGRYSFVTHDGDLMVGVQAGANAQVFVASFDADFMSDLDVELEAGDEDAKRFNFTLGSGSARIELESFDGTIQLTRRGSL
jgi:DUF4097 and DUF4098 domain-containing protein YvlB